MRSLRCRQRTADVVMALSVAGLGGLLWWWVIDLQVPTVSGFGIDARLYPKVVAIALLTSAVGILIQSALDRRDTTWLEMTDGGLLRVIVVIVATGLFITAIPVVGIYAASALAIPAYMVVLGARTAKAIVASAVSVPALVYLVADRLLGIDLTGTLWPAMFPQ